MKNLSFVAALAAALVLAGSAGAQTAQQAPAQPPAAAAAQPALPFAQAMILIRSALTALQQANETNNYVVLNALGSTGFRTANPPARLAQTFAGIRQYNLASILVLEPQFTQLPQINAQGQLTMEGFFLADGYRIAFRLIYVPENSRWRLFGLSAGVTPVTPAPAAGAR